MVNETNLDVAEFAHFNFVRTFSTLSRFDDYYLWTCSMILRILLYERRGAKLLDV